MSLLSCYWSTNSICPSDHSGLGLLYHFCAIIKHHINDGEIFVYLCIFFYCKVGINSVYLTAETDSTAPMNVLLESQIPQLYKWQREAWTKYPNGTAGTNRLSTVAIKIYRRLSCNLENVMFVSADEIIVSPPRSRMFLLIEDIFWFPAGGKTKSLHNRPSLRKSFCESNNCCVHVWYHLLTTCPCGSTIYLFINSHSRCAAASRATVCHLMSAWKIWWIIWHKHGCEIKRAKI